MSIIDHEHELIKEAIETYAKAYKIELSVNQYDQIYRGVQNWITHALDEAVAESFQNIFSK